MISRLLSKCRLDPRQGVVAVPFIWLLLFFLIPFAIVFSISFAESAIAIPPYTDLVEYDGEVLTISLSLGSYQLLLEYDIYFVAYLGSLKIAFISTLLCLGIGFPMAYAIARAPSNLRNVLLMLIILPSWTSFLIRVYAWIGILKNNGLLNNFLMFIGVIDEPIQILYTDVAVYIGIIYAYLPFMVLPLYANLAKLDNSLLEAAADLGAKPTTSFFNITLPQAKSGIIAGSMLVFIPVVGEFVIPELMGSPSTLMIGKVLWEEFFSNRDWPTAAAIASVMLALLVIPIVLFNRYQLKEMEQR